MGIHLSASASTTIDLMNAWEAYGKLSKAPQASSGIRALMLAVFEDGVRCFLGPSRMLAAEAEAWILARDTANPFGFQTLCEVLGLNPAATRRALVRLRAESSGFRSRLPRARYNVRSAARVRPRRPRRRSRARLRPLVAAALAD